MILSIIAFTLGVYLSIQVIAALYRVIDLWYAIGREYPSVLRGLLLWGMLAVLVAWMCGDYQGAFLKGFVGYVVFYLAIYVFRGAVLRAGMR